MQLGYSRPDLLQAMAEAASVLPHARPSRFDTVAAASYREELLRAAGPPYTRVLLASSGSEAVDLAIQAAWWWQRANGRPERTEVLSLHGHYHGATLGALNVTGWRERRDRFAPLLGGRVFGPPAHCTRCFRGLRHPECRIACVDAALEDPSRCAAFLAETIPAAGLAAAVPPPGWMARVRERCDQTGALWIADEVLTGFGRTGALTASSRLSERDRVAAAPDLIVFGKGAAAGFYPVSGVLVADRVAAALDGASLAATGRHSPDAFRHAQTFGGSPIGTTVALRALQVYQSEKCFERARALESEATSILGSLTESEAVRDVRGMGLLWGIELEAQDVDHGAAHGMALAVEQGCRERGVLVHSSSGFTPEAHGEAILVAPPLIVEGNTLKEIAAALRESIEEIAGRAPSRTSITREER